MDEDNLHRHAVPPALQALGRAEAYVARIRGFGAPGPLLGARLAPGMFPLGGQLRSVCGFALRATFPLAGLPLPEAEFSPDLRGLAGAIAHARAEITALPETAFDGAARRRIRHQAGFADLDQSGQDYLTGFALPNLWFHLSMVHAILRREGAGVGKADFDGLHTYPAGFAWSRSGMH